MTVGLDNAGTGPAADGWLGRFYGNACNGLGHPIGMVALGMTRVPPMLRGSSYIPPAISGPDEYKVIGGPDGQEKENERRLVAAKKSSSAGLRSTSRTSTAPSMAGGRTPARLRTPTARSSAVIPTAASRKRA